jgi:hypothetical protein
MNNKAKEKTELVINALEYAHEHELDINNNEDVKKILENVDDRYIDENEVEEFMALLQNADTFMEMNASKKKLKKKDLPN